MKSILFIGAHPDDETLCGGLFLKAKSFGFETHIAICSGGKNGKPNTQEKVGSSQENMIANRNKEFITYCQGVGATTFQILENKNTLLGENEELTLNLLEIMRKIRPSIIITHMNNDYHHEHQTTHNSTKKALELASRSAFLELGPKLVGTVLLEVDGLELINNPDFYLDISDLLDEKIRVTKNAYEERLGSLIEMDTYKAKMRGARKKMKAAECYSLVPVRSIQYSDKGLRSLAELFE